MKKLAILTLLATPALSTPSRFQNPEFLKLSGGDSKAAHELFYYCGISGQDSRSCIKNLSGHGNLSLEAARKCAQTSAATTYTVRFSNGTEIPGSRATYISGTTFQHPDLQPDEQGVLHLHKMSINNRQAGKDEAIKRQTATELALAAQKNSIAVTEGKSIGGGGEFGTSSVAHVVVSINANGNDSKTTTLSLLSEEAKKRIEVAGQFGWDHPEEFGVSASILCRVTEKKCREGMSFTIDNPYYDPKAAEKDKKDDKKDDKKGAENSPKHEDDHTPDIPDIISADGGDLWAGNDTGTPDTVIATPVLDESLAPKSAMENCVEKETKRLNDEFGKTTIDENKLGEEDERKQRAESLLKTGYCQESYYGQEFCAKHAFQQDSVVAIDIKSDREAAAKAALERFQTTGICSPALGSDFCKKAREKWQKTPAGEDPATNPTPSGGKGVRLPDGRVITLPGSPVKSGDLPRKNP